MNNNTPLISIITVVYNSVNLIDKTIESVLRQDINNFEYIIIDGGSTDGTTDIIKKYENHISYWLSEPDKGIYDAMNKAISKSAGSFIYFINCGDVLLELPLQILQHTEADLICFPVQTNNAIRKPYLGFKFFLTNTLPHQGIFYKRSSDVFFNCNYKVFADYALNIDFKRKKKNIETYAAPIVAYHSLDGISNNRKRFTEFFELIKHESGIHFFILSFLYFKWQGIKSRFR